jgi:hypothetical protein
MDSYIDPLAIAIISQLRQEAEQEEAEYTPDEKSTWQMMIDAGVWIGAVFQKVKTTLAPAKNEAYSLGVNANQFDESEVCA